QVEGLEERVEVGGEGVVVVPGADLARRAEPATVVRDDAVPRVDELALLELPAVPVERVAVDEDDRLTGALVLVVELDVGGVRLLLRHVSHCRARLLAAESTVVLSVVVTLESDGSPCMGG